MTFCPKPNWEQVWGSGNLFHASKLLMALSTEHVPHSDKHIVGPRVVLNGWVEYTL